MVKFQTIFDNNKPKFVVLPFGDEKAVQDYMDELWAEKAVAKFIKSKPEKLYSMDELKKKLKQNDATQQAKKK